MGTLQTLSAPVVAADIEKVLIGGDLSKLTPEQRVSYYNAVCKSLNLNPLTKPFAYISLNGKLVLYALKDCTEQLRNQSCISLTLPAREVIEGVYVVTASAVRPDGRHDEATGAVSIDSLKGEARANAMMKAETKAKRRVTLSICGLGMLDESEVDSIADARRVEPDLPAVQRNTPTEQAVLAEKRIQETSKGGAAQHNTGLFANGSGSAHVSAPVPPTTENVPVPLRPIFDGLRKPGAVSDALRLMKDKLEAAMPEFGASEYRAIVEKYGLTGGGGMKLSAVRAALIEMYAVAEAAKVGAVRVSQITGTFQATDDDLPTGLFEEEAPYA